MRHAGSGQWGSLECRKLVNLTYQAQFRTSLAELHLFNNVVHALVCVLLFLVVSDFAGVFLSTFLALVFMAHPINIAAVTYIAQRYTSMACMFSLLSFLAWIRFRAWYRLEWLLLCVVSLGAAFMCKQNTYIMPLVILLYEACNPKNTHKKFLIPLAFFAVAGMLMVDDVGARMVNIFSRYEERQFSPYERLLTECRVIVRYLWMLVYPVSEQFNMSHYVAVSRSVFSPFVLGSIMLHGAIISFAIWFYKRNWLVTFGLLSFYVLMIPESSITNLELMFEHRMYLPLCFVLLGIAPFLRRATWCIPVAVFMLMCYNVDRQEAWESHWNMWSDSARKSPLDARAQYNYACSLVHQQRLDEAVTVLARIPSLPKWRDNAPHKLAKLLLSRDGIDIVDDKIMYLALRSPKLHYLPDTLESLQKPAMLQIEKIVENK